MGQLEKYGVYVLCLVIFLIIGVAIWGDDNVADPRKNPAARTTRDATSNLAAPGAGTAPVGGAPFKLDELIEPESKRGATNPKEVPGPGGGEKPTADKSGTDKSGTGNPGTGSPGTDPKAAGAETPAPQSGGTKPESQTPRTYRVKSGDSFESIARTVLGDVGRRAELERLNPTVKPTRMRVGQELVLPGKASEAAVAVSKDAATPKEGAAKKSEGKTGTEAAVKVASTGERTYVIAKGDTFGRIAQLQLGSSKRIDELRELNPDVDPTRLRIGQRIILPRK